MHTRARTHTQYCILTHTGHTHKYCILTHTGHTHTIAYSRTLDIHAQYSHFNQNTHVLNILIHILPTHNENITHTLQTI